MPPQIRELVDEHASPCPLNIVDIHQFSSCSIGLEDLFGFVDMYVIVLSCHLHPVMDDGGGGRSMKLMMNPVTQNSPFQ